MIAILYNIGSMVRRLMPCLSLFILTSCVAMSPLIAEGQIPEARLMHQEPVQIGHYRVYVSAFNSTFITPEVAKQHNIRRADRNGVVSIAIRDVSNQASEVGVTGAVNGHTINLLSQKVGLQFSETREGSAIYYLADFKFSDQELLKFAIDVRPEGLSRSETIRFEQTFYQ